MSEVNYNNINHIEDIVSQDNVDVFIMPQERLNCILEACKLAKRNLCIFMYTLASATTYKIIEEALLRGIDVRIMINGQCFQGCSKSSNEKVLDHMYLICALKKLKDENNMSGRLETHWSSDNFAISHQKCILIDLYDENWNVISNDQISDTSAAFIMTCNMYVPQWYSDKKKKRNKLNARDFIYSIKDKDAKIYLAKVLKDDFENNSDAMSFIQTSISEDNNGLLFSNGCTNPNYLYPSCGRYVLNSSNIYVNRGNYIKVLEVCISEAQEEILIYNEILTDDTCIRIICEAASRGIKVKIILPQEKLSAVQSSIIKSLSTCGIEFSCSKKQYYQHSKAVIVDRKILISGSHNMSKHSLLYNREISIATRNKNVINTVVSQFIYDFDNSYDKNMNKNIDTNNEMFPLNSYNAKYSGGKEIDEYSIPKKLRPNTSDLDIQDIEKKHKDELV